MRTLLLALHIIGVAGWLGGNFTQLFVVRILEGGGHDVAKVWHSASEAMARSYYNVAGTLIAVTGILLVFDGGWDWSSGFISIGFVTVIVGGALGIFFFQPTSRQIVEAHEAEDDGAVSAALRKLTVGVLVDSSLMIVTIVAMVDKWGI